MGVKWEIGVAQEPLTRREREILRLLSQGLIAKEVAALLSISHRTVEFHKTNLFAKLNVTSVMAAVAAVADIRWPPEYVLPDYVLPGEQR